MPLFREAEMKIKILKFTEFSVNYVIYLLLRHIIQSLEGNVRKRFYLWNTKRSYGLNSPHINSSQPS